jgi:glutamine synthetase
VALYLVALYLSWMTREAAARRGMVATFMPKPLAHLTGNGCHMHLSLYDDKTGACVMEGAGDLGLSKSALHFCGGILSHALGLAAVTNPNVNSYKRLNSAPTLSGSSWAANVERALAAVTSSLESSCCCNQ